MRALQHVEVRRAVRPRCANGSCGFLETAASDKWRLRHPDEGHRPGARPYSRNVDHSLGGTGIGRGRTVLPQMEDDGVDRVIRHGEEGELS